MIITKEQLVEALRHVAYSTSVYESEDDVEREFYVRTEDLKDLIEVDVPANDSDTAD